MEDSPRQHLIDKIRRLVKERREAFQEAFEIFDSHAKWPHHSFCKRIKGLLHEELELYKNERARLNSEFSGETRRVIQKKLDKLKAVHISDANELLQKAVQLASEEGIEAEFLRYKPFKTVQAHRLIRMLNHALRILYLALEKDLSRLPHKTVEGKLKGKMGRLSGIGENEYRTKEVDEYLYHSKRGLELDREVRETAAELRAHSKKARS